MFGSTAPLTDDYVCGFSSYLQPMLCCTWKLFSIFMWVYVHACLYVCGHVCVGVHAYGCTCMWRPKVAGTQPWLHFHLVNCGGVSRSSPELTNMASLTRQLFWRSLSLPPRLDFRLAIPPGIYLGSGALKSGLHACKANVLTTEQSHLCPHTGKIF